MGKITDIRSLADKVLEQGYLVSLACVDDGGPWVSDVIYVSDSHLNLYFISRPQFRHSMAFEKNPAAAASITARDKPEGQSTGVQMAGVVKRIGSIPEDLLVGYARKRGGKPTWKLAEGEAWYQFTPSLIDLIYEPLFGYTKKSFRLT